jgi:hypothetical protein
MKIRSASRQQTALRLGRLLACCLGVVALWACGPVYIPVPPPSQIAFTSEAFTDAAGTSHTLWITAGGQNGNAANGTFYITDLERGSGVIARANADGSFVANPMEGIAGEHIAIYFQEVSGRDSVTACVLLSELPVATSCGGQ